MICLNKMVCPSRATINPQWHRQYHLKGVVRLGNKLNSRNVGHVNNKERKSRWYKFLILMVKLPEKGDFYSKIAKVSIFLLLFAVARGVRGKERKRFIVNLLISYKETLLYDLPKLQGTEKCTGAF